MFDTVFEVEVGQILKKQIYKINFLMFLNGFNMLILKIFFKKKYYFNIF